MGAGLQGGGVVVLGCLLVDPGQLRAPQLPAQDLVKVGGGGGHGAALSLHTRGHGVAAPGPGPPHPRQLLLLRLPLGRALGHVDADAAGPELSAADVAGHEGGRHGCCWLLVTVTSVCNTSSVKCSGVGGEGGPSAEGALNTASCDCARAESGEEEADILPDFNLIFE